MTSFREGGANRSCPTDWDFQLTDPTGVYKGAISFRLGCLSPEHRDAR
jgi:hypothetical protein